MLKCEQEQARNPNWYQLPHSFRKVGIAIAILFFMALFANALTIDSPVLKALIKYGLLIGLLIISLSKEEIEDELVSKLRMQSYSFSFLVGVVYTLVLPLLSWGIDFIRQIGENSIDDTEDFVVLWMLLSIQVFYFEYLKRMHR